MPLTLANWLGIMLVVAVFVGLFLWTATVSGFKEAAKVWSAALALAVVLVGGLFLAAR